MASRIDRLAHEIAELDPEEQTKLMERVEHLTFQRGLHCLSEKYRDRLVAEGDIGKTAARILEELGQIRERLASSERTI